MISANLRGFCYFSFKYMYISLLLKMIKAPMGINPRFSSITTFICIILNEDDKISHINYTFSERLFNEEYLNISFVEENAI